MSEQEFFVKNCSIAATATGITASSLVELRDKLAIVDDSCLYYHFWGTRMNPQYVHSQYHNDFSVWVYQRLHDYVLAERLSIIDPKEFSSLDALKKEVLETIESRLDEYETIYWMKKEDRFHFISSTTIVFETENTISSPENLPNALESFPNSSIFYHFIDARARTLEKIDDFSVWLKNFNGKYDESLIEEIQEIDPYFLSLSEVKDELISITNKYLKT